MASPCADCPAQDGHVLTLRRDGGQTADTEAFSVAYEGDADLRARR